MPPELGLPPEVWLGEPLLPPEAAVLPPLVVLPPTPCPSPAVESLQLIARADQRTIGTAAKKFLRM
jgi:hypothetical protein